MNNDILGKQLNYKKIILAALLLVFFLLLRWNSFSAPFERDEGEYAYSAWILRQGEMPYQHSFLQKPPMIVYTYAFSQIIFGDSLWGPRCLASLFIIGTSIFIYKIVKDKLGETVGWVAVCLFVPMISSPINASLAANTEVFMILPLVAVYYLYSKELTKRKSLYWTISGALSSIALFYKPICLYVLIFIYLLWIIRLYKKGVIEVFQFLIFNVLGFLTASVAFFLPFIKVAKYLWEEVVVFNGLYAEHWGLGLGSFWTSLKAMWPSFWIVYALVIIYFTVRPKGWKGFIGILAFSLLAVFQTTIRHYYILLIPFLSIVCAEALSYLCGKISKGKNIFLFVLVFLTFFIFPVRKGFLLTPEELCLWIYGTNNPFGESQLVSQKLHEVTGEKDLVFVAGSEPQIYYYSKRKALGRFVITYPFIINTKLRERYQKEGISTLSSNLPKAIVYSTSEESGLWNKESPKLFINYLDSLLADNYKLEGAYVRQNGRGRWMEEVESQDLPKASLILYVKK